MRNFALILFILGTYLAWANNEQPLLNTKTKDSIRAILDKINESEEVNKINNDEAFNADQAGLVEDSDSLAKPEGQAQSKNQPSGDLNSTKN